MRRLRGFLVLVLLTAIGCMAAFAQDAPKTPEAPKQQNAPQDTDSPKKKAIALFRVDYFQAPAYKPAELEIRSSLGDETGANTLQGSGKSDVDAIFLQQIPGIDQSIENTFNELGRFSVTSMPQRLGPSSLKTVVQAVKDFRAKTLVVPKAVELGHQAFTAADFNRLVSSTIVVVPSIDSYDIDFQKNVDPKAASPGEYHAEVTLDLLIVDAVDGTTLSDISILAQANNSDSAEKALHAALDSIPLKLEFELRKVPVFRLAAGITQIIRGDIVLEFGKDMGVQIGDEYAIIRTEQVNGESVERQIGLVAVRDLRDRISIGQIIYADPFPRVGDQLKEAPRIGVEGSVYGSGFVTLVTGELSGFSAGVHGVISRGFFALRPVIDISWIIGAGTTFGPDFEIPLSLMIGGEYNLVLGRLTLTPDILGGIIVLLPQDNNEDVLFGGIRMQADLKVSVRITDDLQIFAQGGYAIVFSGGDFNGVVVSAGVTFK